MVTCRHRPQLGKSRERGLSWIWIKTLIQWNKYCTSSGSPVCSEILRPRSTRNKTVETLSGPCVSTVTAAETRKLLTVPCISDTFCQLLVQRWLAAAKYESASILLYMQGLKWLYHKCCRGTVQTEVSHICGESNMFSCCWVRACHIFNIVKKTFCWLSDELTTVSSSLTPAGALFGRRILRRSSFHVPTVHSAIGVLLLLEQGFGTAFQPLCAQSTCPLNVSNGHWRYFCLFETAAHLWLCLRRIGYKILDIHTYICTYVQWLLAPLHHQCGICLTLSQLDH